MSFKGQIICKQCKLAFSLGKLVTPEGDATLQGFAHPSLTSEELGKAVLAFISQHLKHDVSAVGDTAFDEIPDLQDYDLLTEIDDKSAWGKSHSPVMLGGVKLYTIPLGRVRARPPE